MKRISKLSLTCLCCIWMCSATFAQEKKIDSSYNNSYYQGRMELFETLKPPRHAIVFLGNSITERGQWNELLPGKIIMNRGIGGDNTFGVLARLDDILKYKPKKIFLLIGINDIGRGLPLAVIASNYKQIVERIKTLSPKTILNIESVLPMNDAVLKADYLKNKKDSVLQLNIKIRAIADSHHLQYIDLHPVFADDKGDLKSNLTIDGIHLTPSAYVVWVNYLKTKKYL